MMVFLRVIICNLMNKCLLIRRDLTGTWDEPDDRGPGKQKETVRVK